MEKKFELPEVFHKRMIAEYGPTSSEAVLWHSAGLQSATFSDLLKNVPLSDGMSVLDVGAGKCDLYGFLESQIRVGVYGAIDRSSELLDIGKKMFPLVEPWTGDFCHYSTSSQYDLVIANGSLPYVKMYRGRKKQLQIFTEIVQRMYAYSIQFCAFNIYSTRLSEVTGDLASSWFLIEPAELMEIVSALTPRFTIDHSRLTGYVNVVLHKV